MCPLECCTTYAIFFCEKCKAEDLLSYCLNFKNSLLLNWLGTFGYRLFIWSESLLWRLALGSGPVRSGQAFFYFVLVLGPHFSLQLLSVKLNDCMTESLYEVLSVLTSKILTKCLGFDHTKHHVLSSYGHCNLERVTDNLWYSTMESDRMRHSKLVRTQHIL